MAPEAIRIRPAVESDVRQLVALIRALEGLRHAVAMTEGLLREQSFRRSPSEFTCLVAQDDAGTLVGMASYSVRPRAPRTLPSISVNGVFVLPKMRRERIGAALMRGVAQEAIRLECDAISWQVPQGNWEGIGFSDWFGGRSGTSYAEYRLGAQQIRTLAGELDGGTTASREANQPRL
jgi:GNAT superfamily N-acetyltransferase